MPARPELPRLLQRPALASLLLLSSLPAQVEVFALEGTPASGCGQAVAAVGDVDRDGFVDFAVGRRSRAAGPAGSTRTPDATALRSRVRATVTS